MRTSALIAVTILVLSACSVGNDKRLYKSPMPGVNGDMLFKRHSQDGWELYTAEAGRMAVLANGQGISFYISDFPQGRTISIHGPEAPLGTVVLVDENYDSKPDLIEYDNGTVQTTDKLLDGVLDQQIFWKEEKLFVNYEGELVLLRGQHKEKYILINGEKIPMVFKNHVYQPQND